jgi:hypothetical protein
MPTYIRDGGVWKPVSGSSLPEGSTFPSGTRLMFAQSFAPTGWTRVTDDSANNRMLRVVSTGGGGTGGNYDPTVMNVVPSHTHSFSTGGISENHFHSGTTGTVSSDHAHVYSASNNQNVVRGSFGASAPNCNVGVFSAVTSGSGTGISVSTSIAASGSPATNANLPPYYALAFIMRVS